MSTRSYFRATLALIVVMTALRAVGAAAWPLGIDEAYYWLWSRHLDWAYLDHPPAIAYVIRLFAVLGNGAAAIRTGPLLIGAATTYALFLLGQELFDARAGFLAAVLYQSLPVVGVLAVPDTPLVLAWVLMLYMAWQALHGRPARWYGVGLLTGAGLLSKLHMALAAGGLLLFLVARARPALRRREPYAAAALAVLVFLPVLHWNATHDWAMVRFLLHERPRQITVVADDVPGTGAARYLFELGTTPRGLIAIPMLMVQQSLQSLLLYPALLWAIAAAWRRRRDERFAFLVQTALPALTIPLLLGVSIGFVQATWTAPGYLGIIIVLAALWRRPLRLLVAGNGLILIYGLLLPFVPMDYAFADTVYGWRDAAERVRREVASLEPPVVVVADRYGAAAQLAYYLRGEAPVTLLPPPNPASIWPPLCRFAGASAVAVLDERWKPRVEWQAFSAGTEEAAPLVYRFHGRAVRTFRIFRLRGLSAEPQHSGPAP